MLLGVKPHTYPHIGALQMCLLFLLASNIPAIGWVHSVTGQLNPCPQAACSR